MEVSRSDSWVWMTDATSFIPSRQGVGCMRTISLPTHAIDASVGPYPLYSAVDVETRSSTADVSASPPTSIHSTDDGRSARPTTEGVSSMQVIRHESSRLNSARESG